MPSVGERGDRDRREPSAEAVGLLGLDLALVLAERDDGRDRADRHRDADEAQQHAELVVAQLRPGVDEGADDAAHDGSAAGRCRAGRPGFGDRAERRLAERQVEPDGREHAVLEPIVSPRPRRDVDVVRDRHQRGIRLGRDVVEKGHDRGAGLDVERAGRLVGEDERGTPHERACDRDALLLAAGQLLGRRLERCDRPTRSSISAATRLRVQ